MSWVHGQLPGCYSNYSWVFLVCLRWVILTLSSHHCLSCVHFSPLATNNAQMRFSFAFIIPSTCLSYLFLQESNSELHLKKVRRLSKILSFYESFLGYTWIRAGASTFLTGHRLTCPHVHIFSKRQDKGQGRITLSPQKLDRVLYEFFLWNLLLFLCSCLDTI